MLTLAAYLRLNGVNAKEHLVFKELDRVRRYFGKVKEVDEKSIVTKPNITLNKQAAARIIQSSLVRGEGEPHSNHLTCQQASNGSSDPAQRERELKERLIAMRKLKAAQATSSDSPTPIATPIAVSVVPVVAPPIPNDTVMEDQSSAEEGEIEEDSNVQIIEAVLEPTDNDTTQQSSKKRKQGPNNNNNHAGKKANKKARKKKKHAKTDT